MPTITAASARNAMPSTTDPGATVNQAESYGARLIPASVSDGALYWKATTLRHLSADENRGKHNIFVRVLDENGQRDRTPSLRAAYTWAGRQPHEDAPPRQLDKGDADMGHADIDVYKGQHISVWIEGDGLPSDRAENLHTDHDVLDRTSDGQDGNSRYHHSYLVTFQRTRKAVAAGPAPAPAPAPAPTNGHAPTPVVPVPPTDKPAPAEMDQAAYVRDADEIRDGMVLAPGARFTKCWVLRNNGTTTWGPGYLLRQIAGDDMEGPGAVAVPVTPPGADAAINVSFVAPLSAANLRSDWRLANPAGVLFGPRVWTIVQTPATQSAPLSAGEDGSLAPPNGQLMDSSRAVTDVDRAVVAFWNRYGGLVLDECARLGIDVADAVAVLVTESAGRPFGSDGRMVIRFENQQFWHFWGKANPATFQQHFKFDADITWKGHFWRAEADGPWLPCHVGNPQEWQLFDFARSLDETAAIKAMSMGAAQIMGFNHASVGYPTPQAMFAAFEHDAGNQLRALFRFMEVNGLVEAVRAKDYRRFALVYNGPGQPDLYAGRMRNYAAAFAALRPASVGVRRGEQPDRPPGVEAPRAPMPASPKPGAPLSEADPQLYEAWRTHLENGFKNNETMFERILDGFMGPYWSTVWMYRILFGVGVTAFVVAALVGLIQNNVATTLVFGGLSAAAFLGTFISRPLQALEENLMLITWLGIIYNSYWTALAQAQDPDSFSADLDHFTDDAIARIQALMAQHRERSAARPNQP